MWSSTPPHPPRPFSWRRQFEQCFAFILEMVMNLFFLSWIDKGGSRGPRGKGEDYALTQSIKRQSKAMILISPHNLSKVNGPSVVQKERNC